MYTSQVNYEQSDFGYKFVKNYLPPVVEDYVATLNGTGQYWQLSEPIIIPSSANFRVEVDASINYGLSSSWAGIMFGDFSGDLLRFYASKSDGLPSDLKIRIGARRNTGILWVDGALSSLSFYRKSDMVTVNQGNEDYSFVEVGGFSIEVIGSIGGSSDFLDGYVKNLRIYDENDVLTHEIPLTNKSQGAYQVATTTPLGENLYTQEVIENPFLASSQWSYLGEGRWFLDGQGDNSPIVFIQKSEQPQSGYVEFEIESITGGFLTCTSEFIAESKFDTAGVKTFYYENIDDIFEIQFKRSVGSVKTVIKNIKHYDADGVLVATMVGYTPDVWEQV